VLQEALNTLDSMDREVLSLRHFSGSQPSATARLFFLELFGTAKATLATMRGAK